MNVYVWVHMQNMCASSLYVCMYLCIGVHACAHVCMLCLCKCVCMQPCFHVCTYACVCSSSACACMYVYVFVCLCVHLDNIGEWIQVCFMFVCWPTLYGVSMLRIQACMCAYLHAWVSE